LDCFGAKSFFLAAILSWAVVPAAYCQVKPLETPQQTNDKIFQLAQTSQRRLIQIPVGAGDVIRVDVFDVPDLSRDVRVADSGDISLPLVPGRIHAAGLTTFELETKIEDLLMENGLVSHPQVSVFLKEQVSQPVSVVGAVAHPSVFQINRPTTILEILAEAGGISDDAGSVVLITRGGLFPRTAPPPKDAAPPNGGGQDPPQDADAVGSTITVNLKDLLVSGDPTFNIPVYGGDVVAVPKSGMIYVIGAVNQPGGYVLESRGDHVSVLKAVAVAHGLAPYAKGNSAVILRQDPKTGEKHDLPVEVKKIITRNADDVPLQAGDVLYIPDSAGRKALVRLGEAAVVVGTGVAVYRM